MFFSYKRPSRIFLSACFKEIQVFSILARSLAHTKWLFNPNIWAANWADPSGESMVEQPRPIGSERKRQKIELSINTENTT